MLGLGAVESSPTLGLVSSTCLLWCLYVVYLAVNRLYLSPLAKIPGPKLAALSKWYEFYYDVVLNGQFTFHIQDLHQQYGPIIRITPEEIHIEDSNFYDDLYAKTNRQEKYDWTAGRFSSPQGMFTTSGHDHHRMRRAPLNPLFSKKKIADVQPMIRQKVDKLCYRIRQHQETGRYFPLNKAYMALAGDIVMEYAFATSYNHLDVPDFRETMHDPIIAGSALSHLSLQLPIVPRILKALPESLAIKMEPRLALLFRWQNDLGRQIRDIQRGENEAHKDVTHPTIFHELLQSNLPPQEKEASRMQDEAQTIVGAGVSTTGRALTVASFHIINNPEIFKRLQKELSEANPDPMAPLDWLKLEQLPYLSGCVKEGLRLAYGVSARLQRLSPNIIKYNDWEIPPRTPVSMTIVDVSHDESIFPDSHTFIPERWMNNPKTSNGSPLDRYLVVFSRGSRNCLGMNLSLAEIYIALAAVFRSFEFDLYQTDVSDVVLKHDWFVPQVKLDSKGVRVRVKPVET